MLRKHKDATRRRPAPQEPPTSAPAPAAPDDASLRESLGRALVVQKTIFIVLSTSVIAMAASLVHQFLK